MKEGGVSLGTKRSGMRGEEDGEELDLGFGFSASSSDRQPQKMIRTDSFPFRAASSSSITGTVSAAASTSLPPFHLDSVMNSRSSAGSGPTFFYSNGGICESHDSAARALQGSFVASPYISQVAGMNVASPLRYPSFTPAQWRELQRQALIYKHFVSSAPVPHDLLFDARALPTIPPLYPNLARGGGYFNLRFSGNNTDPEPGRCRRTDGKKWRCSRDAAPDQKYCERHLHRGRPRSRKPVEQSHKTTATTATAATTANSTIVTATAAAARSTAPSGAALSHLPAATTCGLTSSPGMFSRPEVKLPFLSMVSEQEPRYLDWMKGGIEAMQTNTADPRSAAAPAPAPLLEPHHYEDHLNLNYYDLNDTCYSFLNQDLPALDLRDAPRRFIDAWSSESSITVNPDSEDCQQHQNHSVSSSGKLSPSTLTLSMSGIGGEDLDQVDMGLSVADHPSAKSPSSSWMNPVSAPGGPLAEVLVQSSNVVSPRDSSGGDGDGGGAMKAASFAGLINLMGQSCCGSERGSPRESPPRVLSSPREVLQRTLLSLSDSSNSSSPTFGASAGRPEMGLQWMSQVKRW